MDGAASTRLGELVIKTLLFCVAVVPLYFGLHELLHEAHHWSRTRNDPNAVYVMGDSRTYDAIDVTALRARTGLTFYSYTQHAMSEYSVLKFAEMIPPGARVLFGPSWGMMVRDKDDASYNSGYSLRGLRMLWNGAGEYWHFRRIFVINRIPFEAPFFRETPYPLQESDVRVMGNLDEVEGFYSGGKPPWFEAKREVLAEAVRVMVEKGCRIELVEIPIPDDTRAMRDAAYGSVVELDLFQHPNVRIHADIPLVHPDGKNVWQDADHMNARGRALMTDYLSERVFGKKT